MSPIKQIPCRLPNGNGDGTGFSWKNSIGKMTVRIQNNDLYSRFVQLSMPNNTSLIRINDNTWEGVYSNIEQSKYTDSITIVQGNLFGDDGPRILNKDRYFACQTKLTEKDLFLYTKLQLRLIRNTIYAFNRYSFKSKDLLELFENAAKNGWLGWDNRGDDGNPVYPVDINFNENQ